MGRRYDVFLCHNGKDKAAVYELALKLREKGIEAWLDKAELPGGIHWLNQAAQALEECRSCAFFVGPNGLGQWQEPEVHMAMDRHVREVKEARERPFSVIPVLLPGTDRDGIPKYLSGHTHVAFGQTLDDDDAVHRLACYIRGTTPGLGPGKPADENECPYRGLEFFDVPHANYFYGRAELTARLVAKLQSSIQNKTPSRFLAIVGASGSGKSSLARAGLVAALKRGAIENSEHWPVLICRPGSDPCSSLAVELGRVAGLDLERQAAFRDRLKERMQQDRTALDADVKLVLSSGDSKRRLVILIDQFEELFTVCRDETLRKAFVDNLVYASQVPQGQALVLLAMRADFYWKCANYADLARALSESQELIGPMTADDLREAIEKPAQRAGCELEQGLIDLLLKEVQHEPGSLPFLQFALKELWNRRTGRRLTTEAYRAIGGVTGALKRKADDVYANLDPTQQQICRRVFLRLTQPGDGTEDTKRRVPLSELEPLSGSLAQVETVLLNLSEAETRLITAEAADGEEFVEVAHEALIRGWPQLRFWIDADRAALLTQRRLTEAANQWKDHGRDASFLYTGARLAAAQEWASAHREEINPFESQFLKASRWHARRQRIQILAVLAVVVLAVTLGWLRIRAQNIEQNKATRAAGLVRQLLGAEISQVPAILQELDAYRPWADPLLWQEDAGAATGSSQKLRLDLALLPVDQGRLQELRELLPRVTPTDFVVLRSALLPWKDLLAEPLWKAALGDGAPETKRKDQDRFQAACAVAAYTPDDPRWRRINTFVAGHLVSLEASALVMWRDALRPAKAQLVEPLATIFRDATQEKFPRNFAAETLADYAADHPSQLFDLLADSESFQFPPLFDKLAASKDQALLLARKELAINLPEKASDDQKERLAKRQANAAVALARMGTLEDVWLKLAASPDPRVRSYVIHWLSARGGDPHPILQRLDTEPDVTIRRALVLTLGEFTEAQLSAAGLSAAGRQPLIEKLLDAYENASDAGLHGAVEWLLRKWGHANRVEALIDKLKIDEKQLQARGPSEQRRWFVNTQRQTFVIVGPGGFLMGSPPTEKGREGSPDGTTETQHPERIERAFAISAQEVTVEQFLRFRKDQPYNKQYAPTADCPVNNVSWYDAAAYCNWLSRQEGIPQNEWSYRPNEHGQFAEGMTCVPRRRGRIGYRLASESEWEFSCRAGTTTSRFYGETEELLEKYARYMKASSDHGTLPVGRLKPNDLGLFDMLGNAWERCEDRYADYTATIDDKQEEAAVKNLEERIIRGGSIYRVASLRCADRERDLPTNRHNYMGFRVVRTFR
jgi:formylglycine-generating enzyme required for sulfatase activity